MQKRGKKARMHPAPLTTTLITHAALTRADA